MQLGHGRLESIILHSWSSATPPSCDTVYKVFTHTISNSVNKPSYEFNNHLRSNPGCFSERRLFRGRDTVGMEPINQILCTNCMEMVTTNIATIYSTWPPPLALTAKNPRICTWCGCVHWWQQFQCMWMHRKVHFSRKLCAARVHLETASPASESEPFCWFVTDITLWPWNSGVCWQLQLHVIFKIRW